jgi:hypothetical protein
MFGGLIVKLENVFFLKLYFGFNAGLARTWHS